MEHFNLDFWFLFGMLGQMLFFSRFVVQLMASEKAKRSVIPPAFWYLSVVGSIILVIYSWSKKDLVFILGFSINILIYLRNIHLINKVEKPD